MMQFNPDTWNGEAVRALIANQPPLREYIERQVIADLIVEGEANNALSLCPKCGAYWRCDCVSPGLRALHEADHAAYRRQQHKDVNDVRCDRRPRCLELEHCFRCERCPDVDREQWRREQGFSSTADSPPS